MSIAQILLVLSFASFVVEVIRTRSVVALGLAFLVLALLFGARM